MKAIKIFIFILFSIQFGCSNDIWNNLKNNQNDPLTIETVTIGGRIINNGDTITDVSPANLIRISFNKSIDPATVTDSTIQISPNPGRTNNTSNEVVTITPSPPFPRNNTFAAVITENIYDIYGYKLETEFTFNFQIASNPYVIQTIPDSSSGLSPDVPVDTKIAIIFSEDMDTAIFGSYEVKDGGNNQSCTHLWEDSRTFLITPYNPFPSPATIDVTIHADYFSQLDGVNNTFYSFSFNTN